jgi:GTP-binding protein
MTPRDSFIDETILIAIAGDGGDGIVAFRREKFVPRGGPNGGDGGRGGDVVIAADRNLTTLWDQRYRPSVKAGDGAAGGGNERTGADGEDAVTRVPVGTVVYDLEEGGEGALLADLVLHGQRVVVARGGRGGLGNARFKGPTRQTPDFATKGKPGERRRLRLSLKLLADVGLVGAPNAGKSTLLRRISAARPRVADYPFTTLVPALGVAALGERRFVVADIPGLLEGASQGVGLGDRFLKHIERTRVLVHLLDVGAPAPQEQGPLAQYDSTRCELSAYDEALRERAEIVALNKIDLVADRATLDATEEAIRSRGREVVRISGATGEGVGELLRAIVRALEAEAREQHG